MTITERCLWEYCPHCQRQRGAQVDLRRGSLTATLPEECTDRPGCRVELQALAGPYDTELTVTERKPFALNGESNIAGPSKIVSICMAVGCGEEVPDTRDWCSRHYAMIPDKLKAPIWHAKTERQKAEALAAAKSALEKREFGERLL